MNVDHGEPEGILRGGGSDACFKGCHHRFAIHSLVIVMNHIRAVLNQLDPRVVPHERVGFLIGRTFASNGFADGCCIPTAGRIEQGNQASNGKAA